MKCVIELLKSKGKTSFFCYFKRREKSFLHAKVIEISQLLLRNAFEMTLSFNKISSSMSFRWSEATRNLPAPAGEVVSLRWRKAHFCLPEEAPSLDEETPHGNLQKCFEPSKI